MKSSGTILVRALENLQCSTCILEVKSYLYYFHNNIYHTMSLYFDKKNILSGPSVRQQDSHMIMEGVSKPLKERIVSIDTKFRKDIFNMNADVNLVLGEKITEVKSIEVDSVDIPITFFNINSYNNSFVIKITNPSVSTHTVFLTPGFYSSLSAIATEINLRLDAIVVDAIVDTGFNVGDVSFNLIGNRGVFSTTSNSYDIYFNGSSGLGWLLGYRGNSYSINGSSKKAISEGVALLKYPRHIYVALNEFSNSSNMNVFHVPGSNSNLNKNIIARVSVPDTGFGTTITASHGNGFLVSEVRRYLEKVNVQRIQVQLLDDAGNVIDMNGGDFAVNLRVVSE